ncbi:MAG: (Fe-S)-binding protein [Rhodospirillales bacterium]
MAETGTAPRVGLFVTCLVDALRPSIGLATARLLERAGCTVAVPAAQTCCGQPAFNNGDDATARALARQAVAAFEAFDYLVAPSGSCLGMIRHGFAELLSGDAAWRDRHAALAAKSFEILSFLADVRGWSPADVRFAAAATYHDSCSGLRQLGIRDQPRRLLAQVDGLTLTPLEGSEVCCGFGGTFCIHYPDISAAIVTAKAERVAATGADVLLVAEPGCLLNIEGRLRRLGHGTRCLHPVEVLAGDEA